MNCDKYFCIISYSKFDLAVAMTIAINGSVLCSFVGKYLHMGIEMEVL